MYIHVFSAMFNQYLLQFMQGSVRCYCRRGAKGKIVKVEVCLCTHYTCDIHLLLYTNHGMM